MYRVLLERAAEKDLGRLPPEVHDRRTQSLVFERRSRVGCLTVVIVMQKPRFALTVGVAIAALSCALSGCVTRTTVRSELRQPVRFASAQAAQTFYEAYVAVYYAPRGPGAVDAGLRLRLPYEHHKIPSDNVLFNSAVRMADCDGDGIISDAEARDYGAKIHKRFAQAAPQD